MVASLEPYALDTRTKTIQLDPGTLRGSRVAITSLPDSSEINNDPLNELARSRTPYLQGLTSSSKTEGAHTDIPDFVLDYLYPVGGDGADGNRLVFWTIAGETEWFGGNGVDKLGRCTVDLHSKSKRSVRSENEKVQRWTDLYGDLRVTIMVRPKVI